MEKKKWIRQPLKRFGTGRAILLEFSLWERWTGTWSILIWLITWKRWQKRRGIVGGPLPRLRAFWIQRKLRFLGAESRGALKRYQEGRQFVPCGKTGHWLLRVTVSDGLFPTYVCLKQLPAHFKTRGMTQVTVSGVPAPALWWNLWECWGAGVTVHRRWKNSRIELVYRKQARHAIFPSDMKKCDLSCLSWCLRIIELGWGGTEGAG